MICTITGRFVSRGALCSLDPLPLLQAEMDSRLSIINAFVNDPRYADYLAIVKGARNGFVYGEYHGPKREVQKIDPKPN